MKINLEIEIDNGKIKFNGFYTSENQMQDFDVIIMTIACIDILKQRLVKGEAIIEPSLACCWNEGGN